ncbi:hypothetical protein F5884DRAFT_866459 [Xylogone sp. PMI_703]|nr:hypothetical protein F5884DRAFT_866459 [Xylogone sp. PMI_703]
MAPISNEEQFKFLISCIRYSNNGKVDFTEVAKECNIVSKGAAAKRYERLMKAHGISPNGSPSKPTPSRAAKTERRNSTSPTKKRKTEVFMGDQDDGGDDDEEIGMVKREENASSFQNFQIKEEDSKQHLSFSAANEMVPPHSFQYGQATYTPTNAGYPPTGFSSPLYNNYMVDTKSPYGFGSSNSADTFAQTTNAPTHTLGYQQSISKRPEEQGSLEGPLVVE